MKIYFHISINTNVYYKGYDMATVAMPGISAPIRHIGSRANMELLYRYAWQRDSGHVITSK